MDKDMERTIIRTFFTQRLQHRVLFELSSAKKRKGALSRLCHTYTSILREEYSFEIPKPNSDPQEIHGLLIRHGAQGTCYVISWNEEIDGREMPLMTALKHVVGLGMPSIVSCIPGKLGYFEAEQEVGPPPRVLLMRE